MPVNASKTSRKTAMPDALTKASRLGVTAGKVVLIFAAAWRIYEADCSDDDLENFKSAQDDFAQSFTVNLCPYRNNSKFS